MDSARQPDKKKWNWTNTPREVIGEGVVLRTGTNSATILTTYSLREFFVGDYVEIEYLFCCSNLEAILEARARRRPGFFSFEGALF